MNNNELGLTIRWVVTVIAIVVIITGMQSCEKHRSDNYVKRAKPLVIDGVVQ
jgi:hypothetical protein